MQGTGFEFMEKTRYRHLGPSAQERGEAQPPLQTMLAEGESIVLPATGDIELGEIGL